VRGQAVEGRGDLCTEHRPQLEEALAKEIAAQIAQARGTRKKAKAEAVLPTPRVASVIRRRTATINLFGRMLAEVPDAHVDGAVQMAPAFTVHPSSPQPDYFTAVEDWAAPNEAGSAHLQTAFFTTGLLYRYATVNLTELTRNLSGDHEQALYLLGLFADSSRRQARSTASPSWSMSDRNDSRFALGRSDNRCTSGSSTSRTE
jgi:CRISPR system Cascade subunit CasC